MGHTVKSVNSVGERSVKTVNEIAKREIKVLCGVHGFSGEEPGGGAETIEGIEQLTLLDDVNSLAFGSDRGRGPGLYRNASSNGWNAGAYTNTEFTAINDEIYIEITNSWAANTGGSHNFMIGLAYKADADANGGFAWLDWALYCAAGSTQIYESGTQKSTVGTAWTADRSFRVHVGGDGTVTYQYSDNDWDSSTTIYTSSTSCTVPRDADGSNLVGAFSIWTGTSQPSACVLENIKVMGPTD